MLASVGEPLRTLQTSDGRTLAFAVWGDRSGFPIMGLHGTPGCRLQRWPHEELYQQLGVCVVTHDRAGYGRSTRRHGRGVADAVDDVIAIADELGFDRFGVTGGSGGGPHALACAALRPDRVVRATSSVGVAPYGVSGRRGTPQQRAGDVRRGPAADRRAGRPRGGRPSPARLRDGA